MKLSETDRGRWPRQKGEMAARIRAHEWHRSALGPPARWPIHLRTATELMIGSAVPTLLILGSDGVILYNDALVPFLGSRHPALLGSALSTGDAEAAVKLRALAAAVRDGQTVIPDDNWLGLPEAETQGMTRLACTPIHNVEGEVGGIWAQMLPQATRRADPKSETDGSISPAALTQGGKSRSDCTRYAHALDEKECGRLQVLVAELQHRTRNLLALVRSIAAQTIGKASGVSHDQYQDFIERLAALSRAQSLITRADAERADLESLLRAELAALRSADSEQILVQGPGVKLTPVHAQTLALVTHELATNAMKYGALRTREGRLSVTWITDSSEAEQTLHLEWRESGVEMPANAGQRRGFGRELIEEALNFSLDARTELRFHADGVECRIDLPLANVQVPNTGTAPLPGRVSSLAEGSSNPPS